jgi:hypothetical protein
VTAPTLPDADALVLEVLRDAVDGQEFGTQIPADLLNSLPYVTVRRVGGASVDPRFLDRATFDVQTWASTRKAAVDVAIACRNALRDAWLNGTVYDLGHIAAFREITAPNELRPSVANTGHLLAVPAPRQRITNRPSQVLGLQP